MKPLRVHSVAEARFYLMVTPCPNCSSGPWETLNSQETYIDTPTSSNMGQLQLTLQARCLKCGYVQEFLFVRQKALTEIEKELQQELIDAQIELINPFPEPSEIIDVGQWLSLFYLLVEKASSAPADQTRRYGFQAAQCLEEALKFYKEGDELPPASAFFVESSRKAFREHPEKFTRQRLIEMRRKLPDLHVMIRRIARNNAPQKPKRWWQFWKR